MGYYSYVTSDTGVIKPAIDDALLAPHKTDAEGYFVFEQHEGDEDVQIVDGKLTVVGTTPSWTSVEFGYDDNGKYYDLDDRVHDLAALCAQQGSKLNMNLRISGEEDGDIWRIRIVDSAAITERPQLVWPNGDVEKL